MENTERLLAKLGQCNLLLSILTLRFTNCLNSILEKVVSHRIPIQTLQFLTALPTRQDGVQNPDKAYSCQEYVFVARKLRASKNLGQRCVIKIISPFYPSFLYHCHTEQRLTEIGRIKRQEERTIFLVFFHSGRHYETNISSHTGKQILFKERISFFILETQNSSKSVPYARCL